MSASDPRDLASSQQESPARLFCAATALLVPDSEAPLKIRCKDAFRPYVGIDRRTPIGAILAPDAERRFAMSVYALRALAVIRLLNGTLGLLAPAVLIRRVGGAGTTQPAAAYAFRMFGIRTVLIGADLLLLQDAELDRAARTAVIIHSCDTVSAAYGGLRKEVPGKVAMMTTTISSVNAALAIIAWRGRRAA